MAHSPYDSNFFQHVAETSGRSAGVVVPLLLRWFQIKSVIDFGAGEGAWLKAFCAHGIEDYLGVDGAYVNTATLKIPVDRFLVRDLNEPVAADRRFDLAVCLEVGEHLPETSADTLVQSLVSHADLIFFSSAIPGQGGTRHLNEQWPSYWAAKFDARGFDCFDFVRWEIWEEPSVEWWYKQNAFIFAQRGAQSSESIAAHRVGRPKSIVHPELYKAAQDAHTRLTSLLQPPRVTWAAKALASSLFAGARFRISRMVGGD